MRIYGIAQITVLVYGLYMVTENETGLLQCDQETKQQSTQWETPASLRPSFKEFKI